MLLLREAKSRNMISPCRSGEGLSVTELQLLSHLTHTMISLLIHLNNLIFNDIKTIDIFQRAKEALVEL